MGLKTMLEGAKLNAVITLQLCTILLLMREQPAVTRASRALRVRLNSP